MKSKKIAVVFEEEEILLLLGFFATDLSFMPLDDSDYGNEIKKIINKLAKTVDVELTFENGRIVKAKDLKRNHVFFKAL